MNKWQRRLLFTLAISFVFLVTSFCYAFYLQLKRAKMASQCAVLSAEIGRYLTEADDAGKPLNIEEFLSHYDGRGLLSRDSSGRLIDSWGRPLVILHAESSGTLRVTVISAGRDGKLGTYDDFSREFTFERKHTNPQ